jgi:superfamily II DNA or RNA helicase
MATKFNSVNTILPEDGVDTFVYKPAQEEALKRIDFLQSLNIGRGYRGIIAIAQSVGKTVVGCEVALKHGVSCNKGVIIVTHAVPMVESWLVSLSKRVYKNKTLFNKSDFKYITISGSSKYASGRDLTPDTDVIIVNIDTLHRLKDMQTYLDWSAMHEDCFVIIDEIHEYLNFMGVSFLKSLSDEVTVIGLSGTPESKDVSKDALLLELFPDGLSNDGTTHEVGTGSYIYKYSMSTAITNDDVMPYEVEVINRNNTSYSSVVSYNNHLLLDNGLINSKDCRDFAEALPEVNLFADVYLNNKDRYGKTIIALKSTKYVTAMTWVLEKLGLSYRIFTAENSTIGSFTVTRDSRDRALTEFKDLNSGVNILLIIKAASTGLDIPVAKTLFYTYPSQKTQFVSQLFGRVGRKHDSKDKCIVVDFIGNFEEMVTWDIENLPSSTDVMEIEVSKQRCIEVEEIDADELRKVFDTLNINVLTSNDVQGIVTSQIVGSLIFKSCDKDGNSLKRIETILVNERLHGKLDDLSEYLLEHQGSISVEVLAEATRVNVFDGDLGTLNIGKLRDIISYFKAHNKLPEFYSIQSITSSFTGIKSLASKIVSNPKIGRIQEYQILQNFWKMNEIVVSKYINFATFKKEYDYYADEYINESQVVPCP